MLRLESLPLKELEKMVFRAAREVVAGHKGTAATLTATEILRRMGVRTGSGPARSAILQILIGKGRVGGWTLIAVERGRRVRLLYKRATGGWNEAPLR